MHHGLAPNFENDPMYLWSMAAMFKLFGAGEFTARFPSAVYGAVAVFAVFLTGRLVAGYLFGSVAALILATTWEFIRFSRYAHLDVCLACFAALAVYFFLRLEKGRIEGDAAYRYGGYRAAVLCGLCSGLAILSKNLIGVFPLAAAAVYYALTLEFRALFSLRFAFAVASAALLPGAWYAYQYLANGVEFFRVHFGYIIFQRAFNNAVEATPAYQYLKIIALTYIPWLLLLIPGLYFVVRAALAGGGGAGVRVTAGLANTAFRRRAFLYLAAFSCVVVGVMSLSSAKKGWYIMSVYPAFSLVSALGFAELYRAGRRRAMLSFARRGAAFMLAAVFIVTVFPVKLYNSVNEEFKYDFARFAKANSQVSMKSGAVVPVGITDDYFDYQLPLVFYSRIVPDRPMTIDDFAKGFGPGEKRLCLMDARNFARDRARLEAAVGASAEIALETANYRLLRIKR